MKKALGLLLGLALAAVSAAQAQTAKDTVEVMLSLLETERKAVVAQNLQLSEGESEKFWPVYNEYAAKLKNLGDRRVALLGDYAAHYDALTDEKAAQLLKQAWELDEARAKARADYAKKLQRALPAVKAARAYQIASKLDAIVDFELARTIPLAK